MPAGQRLRAVLLDMGGVLIPEVPHYDRAARDPQLRDALRRAGINDPAGEIVARGRQLREAYRARAETCTQPDPDEVWADLKPALRRLLLAAFRRQETQPPFAHARDVVRRLARDFQLGLVSNNVIPGDQHARALERAGILQHLAAARWSANEGRRKPHPDLLFQVLAELRVPPRQAVFVGDKRRTDVAAARAAGVRAVLLRRHGAPLEAGPAPDFEIPDLRALPALVRRL